MVKSIYVIKNKINNKVYVGQAINPHRRFIQHLCNGTRLLDSYPIHLAINKYGKDQFYYEVLEKDIKNYNEREEYWIKFYNSTVPNGYNILSGGTPNPVMHGENHPRNTLTNEQVNLIIEELLYTNKSQREIAKDFNTTERILNSINKGETHKKENLDYPLRIKGCHFSKLSLFEIFWLLQNSEASLQSIANYYGLTKGAIAQINRGVSHHNKKFLYPLKQKDGLPLTQQEITILLAKKVEDDINGN